MKVFSYRNVFQWTVVAVLLLSGVTVSVFWIYREYEHRQSTLQRVHADYVALRKAEVRTIVNQLVDEIEFRKNQVENQLRQRVAEQVRMGVSIARAIYDQQHGRLDQQRIKQQIIDTLGALRFFDGRGYYWILDTHSTLLTHPHRDFALGQSDALARDSQGQPIVRNFIQTALDASEGGFVRYFWTGPDLDYQPDPGPDREKIAYVQLFKPYDWVIGAGEYLDVVEAHVQQTQLERIASIRYGQAGYIFNHSREGICLNHIDESLIGENRWEMRNAQGLKLVQELDRVGRQPGGGFLEYVATVDPRTNEPARKISFVRAVDGWGWVLGGGVYLEDIDAQLATLQDDMYSALRSKAATTVFAFALTVGLVLLAMHRLMRWFARELDYFVDDKQTSELRPIDLNRFRIAELRAIAEKSNTILAQKTETQTLLNQAQKMESVGILAGGVAHDFNNLLQVAGAHLERLVQDKPADHPDLSRLTTIKRSLDRAAQLVRQLLLFGRKAESSKVHVDLNQEVDEVLQILDRTIPKMIVLESHLDPLLRPVFADPVQMEQVLLNLANNAVDAMPEGGDLTFATRNVTVEDALARKHAGARSGDHVLLTVADSGLGMEKPVLDQIFDPFFTTKEVGKGTGLGLATVYGIIKAHQGFICCESHPGHGTRFEIYLPAVEHGGKPVREMEAHTMVHNQGGRILVVDDESEIRELTQEALEGFGYEVLGAASGEEALEMYRQQGQDIDLVILDLNMPGMGGHKCMEKLLGLNPAVKIIIASGYTGKGHVSDALSTGAKGFIGKPYQLHELEAKVREVLAGQ